MLALPNGGTESALTADILMYEGKRPRNAPTSTTYRSFPTNPTNNL